MLLWILGQSSTTDLEREKWFELDIGKYDTSARYY
jgi:hypothetical protein